jgi:integrase
MLTERAGEPLVRFWYSRPDEPFEADPAPSVGDQFRSAVFGQGEPSDAPVYEQAAQAQAHQTPHMAATAPGYPPMWGAPASAMPMFSPDLFAIVTSQLIATGWQPPGAASMAPSPGASLRLSDRIGVFIEEFAHLHTRSQTMSFLATLEMFKQLVGDRLLKDITPEDTDVFLRALRGWPMNAGHRPEYRNMLAPAIVRKARQLEEISIHLRTQERHVHKLRRFFKWLEDRSEIRPGLLHKVRLVDQRTPNRRPRSPFSDAELSTIFSSPEITHGNAAHKFWLPMIALYTGMRIREIAQLYVDDVVKVDGRWFFKVGNDKPGQQIKTPQSRRTVPLHDRILAAGFLDYLDDVRRWHHDKLFPELTWKAEGGPGSGASSWFSNVLRAKLGIANKERTFHSFRHGFATFASTSAGIRESLIAELLGHWTGPTTLQVVYRSLSNLQQRCRAIDAIVFPPIQHAVYQQGRFDPQLKRLWVRKQREERFNAIYGKR